MRRAPALCALRCPLADGLGHLHRLQACLARAAVREPLPECSQYAAAPEQVPLLEAGTEGAAGGTGEAGVRGSCLKGATCIWPADCEVRMKLTLKP